MKFYVLIANFSKAKDAVAIFSKREDANNILKNSDSENINAYTIQESEVKGNYNYPDKVFAAHQYNKVWDVFQFIGLYSDFQQAMNEAGKPNLVLNFIPDSNIKSEENVSKSKVILPAYFLELKVENIKCFKEKQTLNLSHKNQPFQWTIILGDNGVGKTTLLQCLASSRKDVLIDENSSRSLDLSKLKNLIRTGSKTFSHVDYKYCYSETLNNYKENHKNIEHLSAELSPNTATTSIKRDNHIDSLICYGYGASRHMDKTSLKEREKSTTFSLFNDNAFLINAEEWLLQADYVASKASAFQNQAKARLEKIKNILINILPSIDDIEFIIPLEAREKPQVRFKTSFGWVPLDSLSLGYKTVIIWMVDLASRLFDRYPDSENPIEEPAIVLIDEIDLHLHPKWQREIIDLITKHFKNTQFIVTAHSPLIVQSAPNANIVLLKKEGDHVVIDNNVENVRGWRVDQILVSDLFDLKSSRPKEYDDLLEERKKLLTKKKLTKKDKERVNEIEQLVPLPVGETPEQIEAMDLILRAAKSLKEKGAL